MSKKIDVLSAIEGGSISLFEAGRPADGRKLDAASVALIDLIEAVDNAIAEWEAGHDGYGPMDYLKFKRSAIGNGGET